MTTTAHPLESLLILDDGTDRESWLLARANPEVITATQAAAIVGSHPYTKLIDVWNEKTDPNYDGDYLRNAWLDERAELGSEREPEIIAWANEDSRIASIDTPFIPNSRLVAFQGNPTDASTPDGARLVGKNLGLIECKVTQQRWDEKGLPQHIIDQTLWQRHTTGAVAVWIAAEFVEWRGKGKNKQAVVVERWVHQVPDNPARLAFILAEVEKFRGWMRDGIAPESDVYLSPDFEIEFDDTPEDIERKREEAETAKRLDALLTEEAELADIIAGHDKRRKEISAEVKSVAKLYEGRRIHLIGTRRIAKFTRFNQAKVDTAKLDPETIQRITSWREADRLVIETNPEYKPESDDGDVPPEEG